MLYLFIFINLFISADAGKDIETLISNPKIVLNGCDSKIRKDTIYTWSFVEKPEESKLTNKDISPNGKHFCYSSFKADEVGYYKIKLNLKDGTENSEDIVNVLVLNSLLTNKLVFNMIKEDIVYSGDLNYYCYEFNPINYTIYSSQNIKYYDFLFDSYSKYYIKEISTLKEYQVYSIKNFQFKRDLNYVITRFLNGYKKDTERVDEVYNLPLNETSGIAIKVENHLSEEVKGIYTGYYENNQKFSLKNPKDLDNEIVSLLFSPNKLKYNYPSIYYSKKIDDEKILKYNNIEYKKLTIKTDKKVIILIESQSIENCLENQDQHSKCIYEKRIKLSQNKDVLLPKGEYKLFKIINGIKTELTSIVLNEDKEYTYQDIKEEVFTSEILVQDDVIAVVFSNGKQKFFFREKDIEIPYGEYQITFYLKNGYYNIDHINISDSRTDLSGTEKNYLNLTFFDDERKKMFIDYFIFDNGYYLSVNDYTLDIVLP